MASEPKKIVRIKRPVKDIPQNTPQQERNFVPPVDGKINHADHVSAATLAENAKRAQAMMDANIVQPSQPTQPEGATPAPELTEEEKAKQLLEFAQYDAQIRSQMSISLGSLRSSLQGVLSQYSHTVNAFMRHQGFWQSENTGEKLMLIVTEISEAMEGARKNSKDDHLPELDSVPVELADAMIRILDFCGQYKIPIGDIIAMKMEYNLQRPFKHGKNC